MKILFGDFRDFRVSVIKTLEWPVGNRVVNEKLNGKRQGAALSADAEKGTFGQSNASGFQALSPNVWKVVNPFSLI